MRQNSKYMNDGLPQVRAAARYHHHRFRAPQNRETRWIDLHRQGSGGSYHLIRHRYRRHCLRLARAHLVLLQYASGLLAVVLSVVGISYTGTAKEYELTFCQLRSHRLLGFSYVLRRGQYY